MNKLQQTGPSASSVVQGLEAKNTLHRGRPKARGTGAKADNVWESEGRI
jgi:hypothetical protein